MILLNEILETIDEVVQSVDVRVASVASGTCFCQMRDRVVWAVAQGRLEADVLAYFDSTRCDRERFSIAKIANSAMLFPAIVQEPSRHEYVLNRSGEWVDSVV